MICYKCNEDLPETSYNKSGIKSTARRGWQAYCKHCMYLYGKEHRKNNKDTYNKRAQNNNKSPENRLKLLLRANTVDRKELDYAWAFNKLEQQEYKCELTGIPFSWEPRDPNALSIDRIDPTKGYTKENVRFVSWWINAAMGNWGYEKLIQLIKDSHFASQQI